MAVTPEDIAVSLGVAAPESDSLLHKQWTAWIEDANLLIRQRLGDDINNVDPELVDYVVRQAVVAHSQNPENATQVTVSVDDSSTSRTYQSSPGRVTILDEWWELLQSATVRGAFTITPTFTPPEDVRRWVP